MDGVAGFDTTRLGVLVAVGSFGYVLKKEERDREREREREEREREREKRERERERATVQTNMRSFQIRPVETIEFFRVDWGRGRFAPPHPPWSRMAALRTTAFSLSLSLSLSLSRSLSL